MKPILQALLLADHAYVDRQTGKHIIAGTFNTLYKKKESSAISPPAPAQAIGEMQAVPIQDQVRAGSPYTYISITGVHGDVHVVLRFVDLDDNSILFQMEIDISAENPDPIATIEMSIPLPVLPAPHAGPYALELLCGRGLDLELIGSHRVKVVEI